MMDSPASGLFAACPIEQPTVHNTSPIVDLPTNIWALIADKLGSAEAFGPVRNIERILWGLRHGREASAVWIYDLHI
jgi:hypothetical protein